MMTFRRLPKSASSACCRGFDTGLFGILWIGSLQRNLDNFTLPCDEGQGVPQSVELFITILVEPGQLLTN